MFQKFKLKGQTHERAWEHCSIKEREAEALNMVSVFMGVS